MILCTAIELIKTLQNYPESAILYCHFDVDDTYDPGIEIKISIDKFETPPEKITELHWHRIDGFLCLPLSDNENVTAILLQ